MKTQNLLLKITTILFTINSYASVNLANYQVDLREVVSLENAEQVKSAAVRSAMASANIAQEIGLDQIVQTSESKLNEIRNEVIVSTKTQSQSSTELRKQNFTILGFDIYIPMSDSKESVINTTKIITQNVEEVQNFDKATTTKFRDLQKSLKDYAVANELALVYAKIFAAKSLQLMTKLSFEDRKSIQPLVDNVVNSVKRFSFLGEHTTQKCITINYVAYADTGTDALNVNLIFKQFQIGGDTWSQPHQAHAEVTCNALTSRLAIITNDKILSAPIAMADLLIEQYEQEVGLKDVVDAKAPYYPNWGSPNFP